MLELCDITYQRDGQPILEGVSLCVQPGTKVGVIGSNAAGKSTLAKISVGLLTPKSGNVKLSGLAYAQMSRHQRCLNVSLVFQDPETQSVSTTVEEEIAFGPENLGFPREKIRHLVEQSLSQLELLDIRHNEMHKLSGGQKQRVAIAACLATQPKVLVLDEPTAMLDSTARQLLLHCLAQARKKLDLSTIYITHRLDELKDADEIYLLHHGMLQKLGNYCELESHRSLLESQGLRLPTDLELPSRLRQLGFDLDLSTLWKAADSLIELATEPPSESPHYSPSIRMNRFNQRSSTRSVPDSNQLFDMTFNLGDGESLGLTGATGSGKSTLLSHLNGLRISDRGEYSYQGELINSSFQRFRWLRQQVGLLFQNPEHFFSHETVELELAFGIDNFEIVSNKENGAQLELIHECLRLVGLDADLLTKGPSELSGGQQRLVALAGVLACRPRVLLLDEPTAGLDAAHIEKVKTLLKQFGGSKIIVSHDLEELSEMTDRVILLDAGRIVKDGLLRQCPSEWAGLGLALPPIPEALSTCWKTPKLCPFTPSQIRPKAAEN